MSRESFLNRANGNLTNSHHRSKKQEKELAKRGGGRLVPGSGSGAVKGDIRKYKGVLRIEAKTTKNKSFSVTREMIDKLEASALAHDEAPAMVIEFIDEAGRPLKEVAVIPTYVLDELLDAANQD